MFNPAYLMLSRHNIYYFRWPLPKAFSAQNQRTHLKISLGTRKPDEALRLSRVLEYHASLLIERYGPSLMKNDNIKTLLMQYLQTVLEKHKQGILENGPLSPEIVQHLETVIAEQKLAIELASDDMIEDDETMARIGLAKSNHVKVEPNISGLDPNIFMQNQHPPKPGE